MGDQATRINHARVFQLSLLGVVVWAGVYARVALGPVQEAMRGALSLSDNQIALLQGSASAVTIILGSIPLGLLIDRYPRVRLLLVFILADLAGSVATALATSFLVLFAARALVGLAAIGALICAFSLIADLYTPGQRGRATIVVASSELGSPAAFAVGGAALVLYGTDFNAWRWALLWMTGPPLILIALATLALREPARTGLLVKDPPVRVAFAELWRFRALVVPLLAARAMVGVADGATIIWAAPLLARRYHLSPGRVGAVMATVLLVAGLSSAIGGGVLADICQRTGGPRRTVRAMGVLAVLSLPASLFGIASSVVWCSVLLAGFVTLGFTVNVAGAALSTIVVPNELRGTFMSVSMVAGAIFGVALAPLLVSSLSGALGGPLMIGTALAAVCVAFSVAGVVIFSWGSRAFPSKASA
jgi:MFS family permease